MLLQQIPDPVSRSALVADAIKATILRGDLKPGQPLVEREIAASLNVSKTPVREALKSLSQSGLVVTSAFRPTHVVEVDRPFIERVCEVRMLLEPEAVRRAVPAHDAASVATVRAALEAAREADGRADRAALTLANREFHQALYAPCDNDLLKSILDGLQDKVALISVVGWSRRTSWAAESAEHEELLRLVAEGEADAAADALRRHMDRFREALLDAMPPTAPEAEGAVGEHEEATG